MKLLPHWVFLGLLLVVVACTLAVPQVWPAIVLVVLAGGAYLLMNRTYEKQEGGNERLGAEPPRG